MKLSLYIITALAAGVLAAPSADKPIDSRAACNNQSRCDTGWSGKCEKYCEDRGLIKRLCQYEANKAAFFPLDRQEYLSGA
ncbi:hypothetical protein QBC38DRAFT_459883 [Podospora fimiseda]|uniref:Uncharacterized protein n=1 Tax=Podospora fimiseda TaxID=252190 RepID=A0AAN6YP72_9PEZI|nr:hypothetical protein QBC38DRAFT_459883 [Podospora fimiseda]